MTKKTGLIVLVIGVAIIGVALLDLTGLSNTPDAGTNITTGTLGAWPPMRLALLAAGALLGVLGAYGVVRKQEKKT
jgi:hypothetical protein